MPSPTADPFRPSPTSAPETPAPEIRGLAVSPARSLRRCGDRSVRERRQRQTARQPSIPAPTKTRVTIVNETLNSRPWTTMRSAMPSTDGHQPGDDRAGPRERGAPEAGDDPGHAERDRERPPHPEEPGEPGVLVVAAPSHEHEHDEDRDVAQQRAARVGRAGRGDRPRPHVRRLRADTMPRRRRLRDRRAGQARGSVPAQGDPLDDAVRWCRSHRRRSAGSRSCPRSRGCPACQW